MPEEITVEEALNTLIEDEEGPDRLVEESDHELPDIRFAVKNYEEVPWYKAPITRKKNRRFEKWQVDQYISDLRTALESWTNNKDYEIQDGNVEAFNTPIDEQLIANMEGEINFGRDEIEYSIYGGSKVTPNQAHPTNPRTHTPGYSMTLIFEGFDGSMTEEYRELYAMSEMLLSEIGRITMDRPSFM